MIELPFTEEMQLRAEKRFKEIKKNASNGGGHFLSNSILTEGESYIGLLVEEAYINYFPESELVDQTSGQQRFDYDVIFRGERCELKTVRRTVKPLPHYACSVNAYTSKFQKPDRYIFSSVEYKGETPKTITLVGWISREDFYKKAKFLKAGTKDFNNIVKKDKYNVLISQLDDIIINKKTNDDIDWN